MNLDYITLKDLKTEIDPANLIVSQADDVHKGLALWLVQINFGKMNLPEDATRAMAEKALAYAKWQTLEILTQKLPDIIERSSLYLVADAAKNGWYAKLDYNSLQDMMSSIYLEDPNQKYHASQHYDFEFVVENILPMAEALKVDPETMTHACLNVKKLRAIVPEVRKLQKRVDVGVATEEQAAYEFKSMLGLAANPAVSYTGLKETVKKLDRVSPLAREVISAYMIQVNDEKTLYIIPASNSEEKRIVAQALKNRVDFRTTKPWGWLKTLRPETEL